MPLAAIALLGVAAFSHALWNALIKRCADPLLILWWTLLVATGVAVLGALATGGLTWPSRDFWPCWFGIGVAETIYFVAIARALESGELAVAYPVSRGLAPAFTVLWAAFFLGERTTHAAGVGIALLVGGVCLAASSGWHEAAYPIRAWRAPTVRWAAGAAMAISICSTIDKYALRFLSPASYCAWDYLAIVLWLTPLVLARRRWTDALGIARSHTSTVFTAGTLMAGTSLLVMHAFALAPASYVVAVRGVNVVAGALIARVVLGERFAPPRVAAVLLLVAGTSWLALRG